MGRSRDIVYSPRRVNKMLVFDGDDRKWTNEVDLSDCETEERREDECDVMDDILEERSIGENYENEDLEDEVNPCTPLRGRKRKLVVTSGSENDDDDNNIPISILKNLKPPNQEMSDLVGTPSTEENERGRLRRQRRVSSRLVDKIYTSRERNSKGRLVGIPITGEAEDDETEEETESDSNSLDGFIVDDETASEKSDETEGDAREEEEPNGETGYADIISRLRRDKNPEKRRWKYEADMLADFGKDAELCMRAVCVLYRLQTEDEKATRSCHVSNGRGFSKFDSGRGTRIGQFLTDGYPAGDLKKSVEELNSFEVGAVEICTQLAYKYSKQLFHIYNNREDPFFTAPSSP